MFEQEAQRAHELLNQYQNVYGRDWHVHVDGAEVSIRDASHRRVALMGRGDLSIDQGHAQFIIASRNHAPQLAQHVRFLHNILSFTVRLPFDDRERERRTITDLSQFGQAARDALTEMLTWPQYSSLRVGQIGRESEEAVDLRHRAVEYILGGDEPLRALVLLCFWDIWFCAVEHILTQEEVQHGKLSISSIIHQNVVDHVSRDLLASWEQCCSTAHEQVKNAASKTEQDE